MEILSVYDSAFKPYGRVVEGYPTEGLVKALATTPCTDGRAWKCCTARRTPRKSAKGCTAECPMSWATATATTRS